MNFFRFFFQFNFNFSYINWYWYCFSFLVSSFASHFSFLHSIQRHSLHTVKWIKATYHYGKLCKSHETKSEKTTTTTIQMLRKRPFPFQFSSDTDLPSFFRFLFFFFFLPHIVFCDRFRRFWFEWRTNRTDKISYLLACLWHIFSIRSKLDTKKYESFVWFFSTLVELVNFDYFNIWKLRKILIEIYKFYHRIHSTFNIFSIQQMLLLSVTVNDFMKLKTLPHYLAHAHQLHCDWLAIVRFSSFSFHTHCSHFTTFFLAFSPVIIK